MTLWDIIRDFFVEYIFGGTNSSEQLFSSSLGYGIFFVNGEYDDAYLMDNTLNILQFNGSQPNEVVYLSIGDWLSTTATIITLCAICVFLFLFVRWLFRLTAGLVSGRG